MKNYLFITLFLVFSNSLLVAQDPAIEITYVDSCAPATIQFTQVNVINPSSSTWVIVGPSLDSLAGESLEVTLDNPGYYTVYLANDSLQLNNDSINIYKNFIVLGPPELDFSYSMNGTSVYFAGQAQFGDNLFWDFGDGQISTEHNPTHVYSQAGDYTVTLSGSNACGDSSVTKTITVYDLGDLMITPIDTTATQFVQNMVAGNKQGVFNVNGQFIGESLGTFKGFGFTGLELDEGIILSTGLIYDAIGPNASPSTGTNLAMPGDNSLQALSTDQVFDATFIEFDFVPSTNVIEFDYVFASEEYPEYVNTQYNDIFGFFVSGPGIAGEQNIAMIPNTGLVVSINTVNADFNSEYYKDNFNDPVDPINLEYDGLTVPMVASLPLTPFDTFHIKMAIGDVLDHFYDSAVFLKAQSFQSKPLVFDFDFTEGNYYQTIFEDSTLLEISVTLPAEAQDDITYHFSYLGDAVQGMDYVAPELFTIPQGETTASFKIAGLKDDDVEGDETLILIVEETQDTLTVTIKDINVLGHHQAAIDMVQLSPNPATDNFSIPIDIAAESVEIYSVEGQLVKRFRKTFSDMDISSLPQGVFYVHITTAEKVLVSKLKVE